ncbi:HEAT repeat domain-containing protein [Streptomyces sp. NPDC055962]|uniref:HEAT repeat domain-containing protein n=1 Tax=Streptomyces sp. NPDC055962 TaxID=3345667 RepID=UPI0035D8C37D
MRSLIPLSPTRYLPPEDRLLLGRSVAASLDTADWAAWVRLDGGIRSATARPRSVRALRSLLGDGHADGRGSVDWTAAPRWDEEAQDVTWSRFPPGEAETAIALCHERWQVRGAALPFSSGRSALLPLLLVRCADRRTEVRERARRMADAALHGREADPSLLVPLAVHLNLRPHGGWALERMLAAAGPRPAGLPGRIRASHVPRARILAARLCLERGLLGPAQLTELVLTAPDRTVRHWCTAALLARVTAGDPDRLLDPLLTASSAVTRSSAVTGLHRAGRGREAARYLADPSARVRSAARLVLRTEGGDPQELHRVLCSDPVAPGVASGALFGLAESGAPGAVALLRPLTAHPDGRVRAAALASLLMLDAASPDELMAAMEDPHPPVVRVARKALAPYVLLVPEEWLTSLVAPDRPRHVRRSGLRLLCAHGPALRKRVLAPLEEDEDPEVAHEAQRARYEPLPPTGPGG